MKKHKEQPLLNDYWKQISIMHMALATNTPRLTDALIDCGVLSNEERAAALNKYRHNLKPYCEQILLLSMFACEMRGVDY